jgi:DNA-binding CsgD family transcriptional regulator
MRHRVGSAVLGVEGAAETAPVFEAAGRSGGIAIDSDVLTQATREKLHYFSEVVFPAGIRHMMWMALRLRGTLVATVALCRRGSGFRESEVQSMRSLLPILALADASFLLPPGIRSHELPLPHLTARERDIVDLVSLGYTNAEIAFALGSSANTVRNQLHAVFIKLGVTTRAELVGLVLRAPPATGNRPQAP